MKVDLTQYHPSMTAGTEGYTESTGGIYSRGSDRFTAVRFAEAGVRDILWTSLEVVDEDYLRRREETKRKNYEALRTARDVVLHLGPNGGFRGLHCTYDIDGCTRHDSIARDEADDVLALFREYGIPVREERAVRQRWN